MPLLQEARRQTFCFALTSTAPGNEALVNQNKSRGICAPVFGKQTVHLRVKPKIGLVVTHRARRRPVLGASSFSPAPGFRIVLRARPSVLALRLGSGRHNGP